MSCHSYDNNRHGKFQHRNYWKSLIIYVSALKCNCPPFPIETMHSFTGKPEHKLKLESSEGFISAFTKFYRFPIGIYIILGTKYVHCTYILI